MKTLAPLAALLASGLVLASAGTAAAGDYYNECKTMDPRFEILDETLTAKAQPGETIPYDVIDKLTTSERRGYCLSRGQKFNFESRNSTMRIRFRYMGSVVETMATCEMGSSGLPADYNCEREVITFDSTGNSGGGGSGGGGGGDQAACGTGTIWNHNGSDMRLLANGAARRFVYERPRKGLERAGVTRCDTVFEGEKQGNQYFGTAYVFSRDCGPAAYPVSGPVGSDGLSVTLYGEAPRRADDCSIVGYRNDKLVFKYLHR